MVPFLLLGQSCDHMVSEGVGIWLLLPKKHWRSRGILAVLLLPKFLVPFSSWSPEFSLRVRSHEGKQGRCGAGRLLFRL